MRAVSYRVLSCCVVASIIPVQSVVADEAPTVSAHGVAVKLVAPTHVRVRFRMFATGKSVSSAMSKILPEQLAIRARLDAVKKDKPEVQFSEVVQQPQSDQSFQQRMMAVAMAGGQKKDEGDQKRTQRLAFEVSLTWPLKKAYAAERLLQIDAIEQQLRELELIDRDEAGKDNSDEDGDEEKSADDAKSDSKEDSKSVVKSQLRFDVRPTYDFIFQATEVEWAELGKAAFDDARTNAEDLAVAAGRKLGVLRSLSDHGASPESVFSQMDKYQSNMVEMFGEGKAKFMEDFPPDSKRTSIDHLRPMQIRKEIHAVFNLD